MSNDRNNILYLWNKINDLIDEKLPKHPPDHTFKSTVWGKNDDGTYVISYKNQKYNVHNALGTDLRIGQSVWVKIPGGVFRHMHICGLAFRK